jgi:hypothetical protein
VWFIHLSVFASDKFLLPLVNGELSNPNSNEPLPDGAEIYLMQKLKGG